MVNYYIYSLVDYKMPKLPVIRNRNRLRPAEKSLKLINNTSILSIKPVIISAPTRSIKVYPKTTKTSTITSDFKKKKEKKNHFLHINKIPRDKWATKNKIDKRFK